MCYHKGHAKSTAGPAGFLSYDLQKSFAKDTVYVLAVKLMAHFHC